MRTNMWLQGLALLLVTPALVGTVAAEETYLVPAGTTVWAEAPIHADVVVIDGILTGPDIVIEAHTVVVRGMIHALDGLQAAPLNGTDGGSVRVDADRFELGPAGLLLAGSGGSGASAIGVGRVAAGSGGDGGDVVVHAEDVDWQGAAWPGAGGDGGQAASLQGGAIGGDGGSSGALVLNGEVLATPAAPASPVTAAMAWSAPDTCDAIRASGRQVIVLEAACAALEGGTVALQPDVCASPTVDCSAAVGQVLGLPHWLANHVTVTCQSLCAQQAPDVLQVVSDAVVGFLAWCGIGQNVVSGGSGASVAGPSCAAILAGVGQDLMDLPSWLLSGAPGAPGLVTISCVEATGEPGKPNPAGTGGDGGDACVDNSGDDGDPGRPGKSGFLNCRAGGNGGDGGNAAAAEAIGGAGGLGANGGGDGGSAYAGAKGGAGGAGGNGGTATFGPDCAGGKGGNGGNGAEARAIGGAGGSTVCGSAGSGGVANVETDGGSGGAGGAGNPAGMSGLSGTAGVGTAFAGPNGVGGGC